MATTMTRWNPMTHADYDALKGTDVFSRDGEKLGSIDAVFHPNQEMPAARGGHYFRLDPGLLKKWFTNREEAYFSERAIEGVTDDGVYLSFTKDTVTQQTWDRPGDLEAYRHA